MLHLIHPALVHFAVAFLVTGGVCEAIGLLLHRETWARFGGALMIGGTLALVPTIATGYLAANSTAVAPSALGDLAAHERNGWFVLALAVACLFWKALGRGRIPPRQHAVYALFLLITVLVTLYSAWLGGQLVYLHGVGVGAR